MYSASEESLQETYQTAKETFRYFWRELWWEGRRIIPALDMACVKASFGQDGYEPEHMWIDEIEFDGITITGVLLNQPNCLTNIKEGDTVSLTVSEIDDWIFAIRGKAYGAFTVQQMRAEMSPQEREAHDEAWGLDFGAPGQIEVAYGQSQDPTVLEQHPMSRNMKDSLKQFLTQSPEQITKADERGYTMLHRESIAGNKTCVDILLQMGADPTAKTVDGYTAADFAQKLGWTL